MKILMTGMSTRTVGSNRLKLNYLNFNPLLKKALEEMGHEVDQRRVTLDENLGSYDLALVHVNPLDKIVCQNVLEVCTTLYKMQDRAIVFLEDWVSVELRNSWNHVLYSRWEKWKKWKGYVWDAEQDSLVKETLEEVLAGSWPVIANFYGWGDPSHFFKDNIGGPRCMIVDPSSMAVIPEFTRPSTKEHFWVLATLQKHDGWTSRQGFTWPIEQYGNARQGHPVLSEEEVVQRYANCWGVLAPRYPVHGWFRPRFLLAAATGSVLLCDPSEGRLLDSVYCVPRSQIENASNLQLATLAENQAQVFQEKIWSKERLFDELSGLIRGVITPSGVTEISMASSHGTSVVG